MQTRSLLVRIAALPLATLTLTLLSNFNSQAQITVDGIRDANYGTALTTQTVTSSWGAGNTLASLSVRQEGTKLYVFVAGRANGNSLVLFVDSKAGGANKLVSGLVSGGGEEWRIHNFSVNGNSVTDGLTFETGFNADFAINVQSAGWTSLFPLDPASPKPRSYMGNMINDATIAGGPVASGKQNTGVDVSNVATHANGWEFEFNITALGVGNGEAESVKFLALIITDGVDLSPNQVLGSLPNSTNLGGWGSFQATNFETISGTQTVTATINNADADGDGIPNSTDTDDDNDGLLDTVETNTGVFVNSSDTGTNPLVADTDGDSVSDATEVAAGKNPNKKNYASMLIAGDFLTPTWSDTPTVSNTMSPVNGDEFGWQIDRFFTTSTPIKFKFLAGAWSTNWGSSGNAGVASPNGGDISLTPGTGVFRFYFNTDTLAFSLTRATFGTYSAYAAAYGIVGNSADDDDGDGLTNQQEFNANTNPLASDSDGDGLSDASEVDGSAALANLGENVLTNPLLADTDGDGLRDDWEISYFLDPTDNGTDSPYTNYIPNDIGLNIQANPNGAGADPDKDSLTNLQEFAAGTSPLAAGSGFVSNNPKITIPGAFNGWNAEGTPANTMVLVGNFSWKSLLYFSAPPVEGRFKFAAGSWSKNWGSGPTPGIAVLEGGDIIGTGTFTAAGYYAVTFNDFTLAYTLAPVASADADADGLPDEYEGFYGGQLPTPTTNLIPTTDYNGDGKTTAQNFADGTNPVKDVVAPSVALAPGIDRVTWWSVGSTIPVPIAADVVATDDITSSPTVTVLSPAPDNSVNGIYTVIYEAVDEAGNSTIFRRVIVVGNAVPGYWNLRFPATMNLNTTSSNFAYGEIFIDGATAGSGQATGVQAWVGVNSNNTDPATWDESAWTAASYIGEEGNNDNYQGVISGSGRAPGTYYYATRFRLGTNTSNTNFLFGGINTNGVGNAWGTVLSTNTNGVVTTNVFGNGVLTVQGVRFVTFAVDMGVQIFKGAFDPSSNGVEVRATFNGFAGGASTLSREGTSSIYSGTFAVGGDEGSSNFFKFFSTGTNAVGYEDGADRQAVLTALDTPLNTGTNFFGNISESRRITFRVDMSVQAAEGAFNTNTGVVHVAGSFNGWSTTATPLTAQGNGIYSAEVIVDGPLSAVTYKFVNGNTEEGYEFGPDRTITASLPNLASSSLDPVLFSNDDGNSPTDISLSSSSIAENNTVNAVVGSLSTTDATVGDTHTYSLVSGEGSTDNASFNISGNSLRASAAFDFETRSSYSVRVRSTDSSGNSLEKAFVITVSDVAEGNTFTSWSGGSAETNSANLLKYAIGGASSLTANDGAAPVTSVTSSNLSITAIVRTDDPKLQVVGETVSNLTGTWDTNGVTVTGANEGVSQTGLEGRSGLERKTFSVERGADTRRFLRIKGVLNP